MRIGLPGVKQVSRRSGGRRMGQKPPNTGIVAGSPPPMTGYSNLDFGRPRRGAWQRRGKANLPPGPTGQWGSPGSRPAPKPTPGPATSPGLAKRPGSAMPAGGFGGSISSVESRTRGLARREGAQNDIANRDRERVAARMGMRQDYRSQQKDRQEGARAAIARNQARVKQAKFAGAMGASGGPGRGPGAATPFSPGGMLGRPATGINKRVAGRTRARIQERAGARRSVGRA